MAYREDLFTHTINSLNSGKVQREASEKLANLVEQCRATGKKGKLKIELEINPDAAGQGQYVIKDDVVVTLPKFPRSSTYLWGTPDGNLQTHDPHQGNLDLRVVHQKQEAPKTVTSSNEPAKVIG